MSDFHQFLVLSDLHLGAQATAQGRCPNTSFVQVLDYIEQHHSEAEVVFITGDLVDNGVEAEYELLREALSGFPLPVHLTLGNHDDPNAFRRVFGPNLSSRSKVELQNGTPCYVLDTHLAGQNAGRLGASQLDWFKERLAEDTRPAFVFMHHPPGLVAVPSFDAIGLTDRDALGPIIDAAPQIRAAFFGHCHMPLSGRFGQMPGYCVSSTFVQFRPSSKKVKFGLNKTAPPGFGVVFHTPSSFIYHAVGLPQ
ncbi:MAG: metallophosphoesterase [Pseudomonadota bacterium]